jgi:Mlc titration factor MtfA (ptsG expression regulator)
VLGLLKRRHREAVRAQPFPDELRAHVRRAVHLYDRLAEEDRRELEGDILVFLDEKRFEGAGGLAITPEIRATIAAQACLLLLHRDTAVYPDLETIVVYPHTYVVRATHHEGPIVIEGPEARLGESWGRGLVVLAWDQVQRDVTQPRTGRNVVLHEFAHQLDAEDGTVDGAPALGARARYRQWADVLGEEYEALGERLREGLGSDIDAYAATSPPEFFAVVTEEFFERPDMLRARHPALYDELASFYRLDPATLLATTGERGG